MSHAQPLSPAPSVYRGVIRFTLVQQAAAVLLCLLFLDGGAKARVCGIALVGFWLGVAWIVARRPSRPTPTDLLFIRWGFLPLLAASLALAAI